MSLAFVVKVPEGLVLAAESRTTVAFQDKEKKRRFEGTYDNTPKVLSFAGHDYVGAVTCGVAVIGLRAIHTFLPELEEYIKPDKLSIYDFSKKISDFFMQQWENAKMPKTTEQSLFFFVAGFDQEERFGRVYLIDIPTKPDPVEQLWRKDGGHVFQLTYAGQLLIAHRLLKGYDPMLKSVMNSVDQKTKESLYKELELAFLIPYSQLSLQDSVDLAIFLIRTTIEAQRYALNPRGCGGEIDVCTITKEKGLSYVQCKSISGELPSFRRCV